MIRKIAGWLVLVPFFVLLVGFALANRHLVILNINPLAPDTGLGAPGAGVPLFLVLYAVLLVGVLLGGLAAWFAQSPHRQAERHWRREAGQLAEEIERLRRHKEIPRGTRGTEIDDLLDIR